MMGVVQGELARRRRANRRLLPLLRATEQSDGADLL
jgi:hypothetical protein